LEPNLWRSASLPPGPETGCLLIWNSALRCGKLVTFCTLSSSPFITS
jgi:hypothetical protein